MCYFKPIGYNSGYLHFLDWLVAPFPRSRVLSSLPEDEVAKNFNAVFCPIRALAENGIADLKARATGLAGPATNSILCVSFLRKKCNKIDLPAGKIYDASSVKYSSLP